ncbi:MAG: AAA family ATPase [Chitinophagaceae bacterium]|nr:AAA family ATPase [Chitinophagaceae bacterium]
MPIRQQRLHKIEFIQLKGLSNFELDLETHNVTGIFGINGSGKSTILHALLSIYKPSDQDLLRKNYKFSNFTPTTHSRWIGSLFNITYSYRQDQIEFLQQTREYSKAVSRWKPRYEYRPERNVYFLGIETCVPAIETEKISSLITLTTTGLNDPLSNTIRQRANFIMNRQYQEYNIHDNNARGRRYLGVRFNNTSYSSLSMGAGEQRIFKILDTLYKAEMHSLIIIDELDLTLHTDALNRLITVIVERATERNLQVIFTSHREEISKRMDINIRHIYQTGTGTFCFNSTNPDCISRLTGTQVRPLEIFVEDDLSELIVQKITEELNIVRFCSIKRFGAASNSFSLAAGMLLKGENLTDIGVFLDGDIYRTTQEKNTQMEKHLSGNEANAVHRRANALSCIRQFALPDNTTPEQFINTALRDLNDGSEVCNAALGINGVLDKHEYIYRIVTTLGYQEKLVGLAKVVDKLSITPGWHDYTNPIREWLANRTAALNLNP